jgi:hypothetical protein
MTDLRGSTPGHGAPQTAAAEAADDLVPVSVRLGTVVPPEDPEDWRRPLTWLAATGMLLAPALALFMLAIWSPTASGRPAPATWLIAGALVIGGVLTGSTQQRPGWAAAATLGSALFAALLLVLFVAAVSPVALRTGTFSAQVAQTISGSAAGLGGALAAATLMPAFTRMPSRLRRGLAPAAIGVAVSAIIVRLLLPA